MFLDFITPSSLFIKNNSFGFKSNKNSDIIIISDHITKRFSKFVGGCLVVGNLFGLLKALIIYAVNYKRNIYVPANLFEKYSSFYSLKFGLHGSILFLISLIF